MSAGFRAVELRGTIDPDHRLRVSADLPESRPGPVRVLVLIPDSDEIDESGWLRAARINSTFDFLHDPREDVYSLADGKLFHDPG